jgi:hypothetical protein
MTQEITERLINLTMEIEDGTGQSLENLQLNAAVLLEDVCFALGLDEDQTRLVLGDSYKAISGPTSLKIQKESPTPKRRAPSRTTGYQTKARLTLFYPKSEV